jgi:uncharacterized membrane protein
MDDKEERKILEKLLRLKYEQLGEQEKKVAHHLTTRAPISRDTSKEFEDRLTFGQRLADRVAAFGGSWTFISIFGGVLLLWILLNAFLLMGSGKTFDPYPYILLNLVLSMLAAIQAPIILMSQNRHADKDRLSAQHDYEVNLKSELEIMALNEKIDLLREKQWNELISIQKEQLGLLSQLAEGLKKKR